MVIRKHFNMFMAVEIFEEQTHKIMSIVLVVFIDLFCVIFRF